jgi:hypothetical protein
LALDILKKSRAAQKYLKSKYYRIFIDEYQDSDVDMHNLFMYICKSLNIPLFIVGDTKQSIYGWRGGYLKGFKDLLVDESFNPFTLIHNFRSNVQIQDYSNIFMDDVRSNYQECTITDEIIAFAYKQDRYAIDFIREWINEDENCAFLIRANANAQTWSDNLQKSGIDFMFLPSSPLDNSDLESEHVWVARLLAFYFLQERFSEYDFIDEMPSAESYDFKTIKKKLQAIRKDHSGFEQLRSNCISLYEYVGYEASDKIESVSYPFLETSSYYMAAKKYLKGASGVVTIVIKGGKDNAIRFMDGLKLASNEVHVADIRTCVLHPASGTHRQLTDEQLLAAGINPGMIRFSVGLENIDDILEDIRQSLERI